jgi:hypothetical protein
VAATKLGLHTLTASHNLANDETPNDSKTDTTLVGDGSVPPTLLYFSLQTTGSVGGVAVGDEDIVASTARASA